MILIDDTHFIPIFYLCTLVLRERSKFVALENHFILSYHEVLHIIFILCFLFLRYTVEYSFASGFTVHSVRIVNVSTIFLHWESNSIQIIFILNSKLVKTQNEQENTEIHNYTLKMKKYLTESVFLLFMTMMVVYKALQKLNCSYRPFKHDWNRQRYEQCIRNFHPSAVCTTLSMVDRIIIDTFILFRSVYSPLNITETVRLVASLFILYLRKSSQTCITYTGACAFLYLLVVPTLLEKFVWFVVSTD